MGGGYMLNPPVITLSDELSCGVGAGLGGMGTSTGSFDTGAPKRNFGEWAPSPNRPQ